MAMGICRQGSLSGGELGREIPSAVRGTVQLPFFKIQKYRDLNCHHALKHRENNTSPQITIDSFTHKNDDIKHHKENSSSPFSSQSPP
ncbi:hypothetical protein Hanom_Chr03g00267321 [Helianthus anomalus]